MAKIIESIYAFITTIEDGKERIVIIYDEMKRAVQPMIVLGDDWETLKAYRESIIETAKKHGLCVELVKFTQKETIEVIGEKHLLS